MLSMPMIKRPVIFALLCAALQPASLLFADEKTPPKESETSVENGWVTVKPPEFEGAINNPLKGFRDYKEGGYGLLVRSYVKWNEIEIGEGDSVERIIAHTNKITKANGKNFEDINAKLVPRVYLDWDGSSGKQYWPKDLHTFDYDSPAFHKRLTDLIAKLGQAWDNDPRIFAVQMGMIGYWGEHHNPAPTSTQLQLLANAFKKAFKNKPVLVRHNDAEFMNAGFGLYYDTYGYIGREPPHGPADQFPMQATHVHPNVWKTAPIEGEVEYNWQKTRDSAKPEETFGRTENETMIVPKYRNYMIDKIRRYHTSYLGWIDNYDPEKPDVLAGAGELQKAFGYRFVLDSVSYPLAVKPGAKLPVKMTVRNTGSAPFYLDWPVAVALLDPATAEPVWSAPLSEIDIREWMPGEEWDSEKFAYRRPAEPHLAAGFATLPANIQAGPYILALAILDRQGGMLPSVRFATSNYYRGGWHPLGFIGIGQEPKQTALQLAQFDSPAFDDSIHYKLPQGIRETKFPDEPKVKAVKPWSPDPKVELINPHRYWTHDSSDHHLDKQILTEGKRVIRITGDFKKGSSLSYSFGNGVKLPAGKYRFTFSVRGTIGEEAEFELGDDWRTVSKEGKIPITNSWKEHSIEFEIKNEFKESTVLRLRLPDSDKGKANFDLTNPRLIKSN